MRRDVGNMGEKHFSSLCSATGITANKSEIDNKGWDYIVEFPFEFNEEYTDLIEFPIKCLVQVKATDDKKCLSWSIKLNNLHHFVKTQLPTFFCLIKFDGEDSVQSIYLLHIDKNLIEETLKTIRECSVKGQDIKNVKKTIRFKKEHLLKEISGKSLKDTIENYIPMGMDEYSKHKSILVKNIGYEDGTAKISLQLIPSELRDATLGIVNKIQVKDFQHFDKRFGICTTKPKFSIDDGILEIMPKSQGELIVMFSKEEHETGIKIKFHKYCSNIDEHLPFEQRKFRLKSDFIEIIIVSSKSTFIFKIEDEDKIFMINEMNKNYQLLDILKNENKLYIYFHHNDDFLPAFSIQLTSYNYDIEDNFNQFYIAHKYYKILEKYDLHGKNSTSLKNIYQNSNNIDYFYTIASNNNKSYKITFDLQDGNSFSYKEPDKFAGIVLTSTTIENYKFICIFAIIAEKITINLNGKYELISKQTGYHRFLRFPLSKNIEEILDKDIDKVIDKISSDGIISIGVFDINNFNFKRVTSP